MSKRMMKRLLACLFIIATGLTTNVSATSYEFRRTISREVLENYLSKSITVADIMWFRSDMAGPVLNMIKNIHAKFLGRAILTWGGEQVIDQLMDTAAPLVTVVHNADADVIVQGCIFEIITQNVNQVPIPAWVFQEFDLPVETRNFSYDAMIYPNGTFWNHWGQGASVPDMSQLETRMWFFYFAKRYIDIGVEAIHFGQVSLMDLSDSQHYYWLDMLTRVRNYAAAHARRELILCDAHVPTGGILVDSKLLFDFHSFPLCIQEVPERPEQGWLDETKGIYGRSKGGITPSGWVCEHLPYLVELDNWGASGHPGQHVPGWIWGYDEICWFAHQDMEYRNQWLHYAWNWVREHDPNGYFQMPGSRILAEPVGDKNFYFANIPSESIPDGFGQEDTIKEIWWGSVVEEGEGEMEGEPDNFHPADSDKDWRMVIGESIAYLAGWQQGSNPISYAIRAAYLWQNGEYYGYDGAQGLPMCWILPPAVEGEGYGEGEMEGEGEGEDEVPDEGEGEVPEEGEKEGEIEGETETILLPGGVPLEMVWIPGNTFHMGRYPSEQNSYDNEDPQHTVTVPGFWMGKYEVTKAQWTAVMGTTPWSGWNYVLDDPDSPAVYVSWNNAHTFITALNTYTGQTFRLPSEAEWEYACRAGTTTRFYWNEDPSNTLGNAYCWWWYNTYYVGEKYAHVVGLKVPNDFGLFDMSGNVWEWCEDDWHESYTGAPSDGLAWVSSPRGSYRVIRGGSWYNYGSYCRSANRSSSTLSFAFYWTGFRLSK